MEYRLLERLGVKVSAVGFGGSSLGGVFRGIDEAEAIRSVHVALDHGVNLLDTAPYYGATKAEIVMGKALKGIPRDHYLLATKVGRYGLGPDDFDFSPERVVESVDESLVRLGVDYIDFIQVHDIEFGNICQIVNETIPALRRAREAGKVRFIGVTGLPVKLLLRVVQETEIDQIQSYCHYCLNDDALMEFIPEFEKRQIAIFNSAPLAMRLLSSEGPPDWHPAPAEVRRRCAEAAEYCRQRGVELGSLALQFAVSEPSIHTNIIGSASPTRIAQNIHDAAKPANRTILAAILEILRPIHNVTWSSGLAENNRCL